MSEEKIVIPQPSFEPAPVVNVNEDQKLRLYDADTGIDTETGERFRFQGIDAQEMPSFNLNEGFSTDLFADAQRETVKDYIENRGFNKLQPIGETDNYQRTLARLKGDSDQDLAYTLTKEGILPPSKYNLDDSTLNEAWTSSRFDALIGSQQNLPAWKQLENQIYQGQVPRLGRLTWTEQQALPSSLKPINKAIDNSFAGQAEDAIELWWYQNVGAWEGLDALFVDEERGIEGMKSVQAEINREISPGTIISLQQIEDVPDAFAWLQNNIIMHLPDLAIMAGGGKAGAATGFAIGGPAGAVAGGIIGSLISTGYIYGKTVGNIAQEQYETTGELDQAQALTLGAAITTIDKIGASGILKPTDLLSKSGMDDAVNKLVLAREVAGETITNTQAKKIIQDGVKDNLIKIAAETKINVADLLSKRQIALNTGLKIAKEAGKEGLTEAVQESIQYLGIKGIPQTQEEWERFGMRLADASAAGTAVGGVYNAGNALSERNRIESLRDALTDYDPESSPLMQRLAIEGNKIVRDQNGNNRTIEQVTNDYKGAVSGDDIHTRNERGSKKGYARRALDKLFNGKYLPGLSAIKNTIKPYLIKKNGQISKAAMFLANLEGAYQNMFGNTLYNEEQTRLSDIMMSHAWLNDPRGYFNVDSDVDVDRVSRIIDTLYAQGFNLDLFQGDDKIIAETIGNDLANIQMKLKDYYLQAHNGQIDPIMESLFDSPNFLLTPGLPDSTKVFSNSQKFKDALANHILPVDFGGRTAGQKVGDQIAQEILDDIFERNGSKVVKFLSTVQAHDSLKEFFSDNSYENVKNKLLGEITGITRQQYRGDNYEVYSNAINEMVNEGVISEEEADALAADLMDQIKKHSREFGRLQNEQLAKTQDMARTVTSFGIMDFVLFSQMGEAVLAFMGTNQGVTKSIGNFAFRFAESFKNSLPSINNKRKEVDKNIEEYKRFGYHGDELLQQQGADINNKFYRDIQKTFYRLNLLEQTTDAIRMSRMVLAADTINQLVEQLVGANFDKLTNHQAKIYERLSFYGGDPKRLAEIFEIAGKVDPKEIDKGVLRLYPDLEKEMQDYWMVMVPKFIDETTVRIKPGSRPTMFEDQRYGLPFLTQYLSFTAHFHANILPRIYTTYLKDAAAPMAFSTFKLMGSAVLVAYLSQFLKDLLLKGELNPNLEENTGVVQRAIQYSGFLGWGQEAWDNVFGNPYGFKSEGLLDYMSSYPTYSHLSRVVKEVGEGDFTSAAQRALPFGELTKSTAAPSRLIDFLTGE